MSEDQIRTELQQIRVLIRESNADLNQQIRINHESTLEQVEKKNGEIVNMLKWFCGILFALLMSFGGWLAVDHLTFKNKTETELHGMKADHKELKNDFGIILRTTEIDHKNCVGFDEMVNKYFPSRGATK